MAIGRVSRQAVKQLVTNFDTLLEKVDQISLRSNSSDSAQGLIRAQYEVAESLTRLARAECSHDFTDRRALNWDGQPFSLNSWSTYRPDAYAKVCRACELIVEREPSA